MLRIHRFQRNIMIPYRDMFIFLAAADTIRIKPYDMNCMSSKWDHAKEPKPISGRAANLPSGDCFSNRFNLHLFLLEGLYNGLCGKRWLAISN